MSYTYYFEFLNAQNLLELERSNSSMLQQQVYDLENEVNRLRAEVEEKWEIINSLNSQIKELEQEKADREEEDRGMAFERDILD